jgi:hypothetical protein
VPNSSSPTQLTKRCHWVPQAYLRAFAADTQRRKIWRFSKDAGEPELKPIEKVAVSFYLYVPRDPNTGARDDSFEKKLSELERWFADPVWRALQVDMLDLSWEPLRKMVSLLAATMMLRNPRHFEMYKQWHRRICDEIEQLGEVPHSFLHKDRTYRFDTASWPAYRDATEDDLKRSWIKDMHGAAEYANQFMGMRWSMLCAEEPVFITTDAPVTLVHPSLRFRGIANPQTSILFPVSPTRLLCMDHLMHEPHNQYYPLHGSGAAQNLLLWRNSLEHMFSHRHTDEVCAAMLAEEEAFKAASEQA